MDLHTKGARNRTHISLEWIPVLDTSLEWIFTPRGPGTGEDSNFIQQEIAILADCKHPNIVGYSGSYLRRDRIWIAMEFCGGGSLQDIYHALTSGLNELQIAFVCREILKGLQYLHERNKVHRDIKGANILLTNIGEVKLADFSKAAQLTQTLLKSFIGTPYWMAPEVAAVEKNGGYNQQCDIWAVGITAIELAETRPPMFDLHPMRALYLMTKVNFKSPGLQHKNKWSENFHEFLKYALQKEPRKRPMAHELLLHEFVNRNALCAALMLPLIVVLEAPPPKSRTPVDDDTEDENPPAEKNHDESSEKDKFIKSVEGAIAEDKPVSRKHAHSIFVGPPGSGKSSLMARLLRRPRKTFSRSTGVSESVVIVDIDVSSSFHAATVIDHNTWSEVDFDASLVRQMKTGRESWSGTASQSVQPTVSGSVMTGSATPAESPVTTLFTPSVPDLHRAYASNKKSLPVKLATSFMLSEGEIREMISAAIKKCGGYEEFSKSFSNSFSLYLRDAGGQMAFQEMLSVLILGPSIFIFVFRLDIDLKNKFSVEYRVGPNESLNCNTSSLTTEEALLQCLASVYAMDTPANASIKTHKPLVFIVGTHKDKLGPSPDEKIAEINKYLDSLINHSSCFQDLVQYADKGQVMFTIDNTSESDEDFELIRSRIYSLVSERNEFTIEYPVRYLLFSLQLQHEQCRVLSFEECESIAAKYGIVGDEVSRLLQFLHFRVGVIQYFSNEGLVMIKPQVLFSKVTDLVRRTFSHKFLTTKEMQDFQKGILKASLIRDVVKDEDITSEKFIQLLTRLCIITPFTLPGEQEERYFMPCVLKHVQESSQEELPTDILPLAVQFECEHCPKGLFSVLVTHLMTAEEIGKQTSFTLIRDKIFRDQVSFEIHSLAEEDEMSVKAFPSRLEVCFFPSSCDDRDVTIEEVCNTVRKMLETSISKSLNYLCYAKEKVMPMMCFKCESCHELHPVKKGKNYHKMHCKRHRKTGRLPPMGRCWYGEDIIDASSMSGAATSSKSLLQASPTKLNEHDHFHIIFDQLRPHSARWRDIGIGLRFLPSQLDTIQASPFHLPNAPSSYMCAMLAQWLQSAPGDTRGNTGHATLESLKEAVDKAGLGADAQRLHI